MAVARRLKEHLDAEKVKYHVLKHHECYTAPEIAHELHVPGRELAKVVIVKADDRMVMAVLPANLHIGLEKFAGVAGARQAVLASEEEFGSAFPDCELGAMPPFGNLYGIEVFVDQSLTADEEIVFEAGSHHEAIKLAYEDFARLVDPTVGEFSS